MTTLVAVVYKDAATANAALAKLRDLSNQYLIELEDAVIVTKDQQGKIQLHQSVNLTAAGATSGAFWGMLIGLIFFIPIGGLVIGAVMGALGCAVPPECAGASHHDPMVMATRMSHAHVVACWPVVVLVFVTITSSRRRGRR